MLVIALMLAVAASSSLPEEPNLLAAMYGIDPEVARLIEKEIQRTRGSA